MGKGPDEQTGQRHRVARSGQLYYFYISDTDIMFSAPNEGDIKNQDAYSSINAICRLASVARSHGASWERIVKQMDGANIAGNRTWVKDIAQVIREAINHP